MSAQLDLFADGARVEDLQCQIDFLAGEVARVGGENAALHARLAATEKLMLQLHKETLDQVSAHYERLSTIETRVGIRARPVIPIGGRERSVA